MSWIADPALGRIWAVLRERVEARGLRAEGRIVLTGLTRAERHAATTLVGRPVTASRLTIDLAELDAWLAERSGVGGLVAVLEAATGAAMVDRRALRARRAAARESPFTLARTLLAGQPWLQEWIDELRRSGTLSRTADPEAAVRLAAGALARLPAATSRTELATAVGGDAHALDDGTTAAALVLRALAARSGEPVPTTTADRRALWERYGVRVDLISTTCLTLGLRATGAAGARLDLAADAGDPVHLTPWDLRRCILDPPATVLVCENPRVLEAVAERFGGRVPVVCTSGQPALVVLDVLAALAGARLRYHGDFDWPGVAIANRLIAEAGVVPWRMGAGDYLGALGRARLPLAGAPVEPAWDAELGAAMRHHGVAVHEEAVLGDLLAAFE
ncbi:TIGR02679 family protein [Pseudonocardia hispaniensis]|uniref:TIGR02679 family protein n=1 Tax=Pseudonocardia hispaniensis TaxID=904933 RepID=A0ABW1IYW9_9PSEU